MQVTSLEQLKNISQGEVVALPGFTDEPFVARLKRPALLDLVASGQIPNPLLNVAYKVFYGEETQGKKNENNMKEHGELLKIVARKALVEPSYAQLEELGLELTDLQLMMIFNYTQQGAKVLEPFRTIE